MPVRGTQLCQGFLGRSQQPPNTQEAGIPTFTIDDTTGCDTELAPSQGCGSRPATPDAATLAAARALALRVARRLLDADTREGIDAEDVAQDVLIRLATTNPDDMGNWQAWVTRATQNRAIDLMRATLRHRNIDVERFGDTPDGEARPTEPIPTALVALGPSAAAMHGQLVAHTTAVLSAVERRVLFHHLAGWSNTEIAEQFGYAGPDVVAVTLSRARRRILTAFPAGRGRDLLLGNQRPY